VKYRYTLIYGALVIGVILFLSFIHFLVLTEIIATNQVEAEFELAFSTASDLSNNFSSHEAALQTEASRIPIEINDQGILIRNLRLLSQSNYYNFINVSYTNLDGVTVSSNRAMLEYDADLTKENFDEAVYSGPYIEENSLIPIMMISLPVYMDNQVIGKISGYIDLNLLHDYIRELSELIDGDVAIFNQDLYWLVDSRAEVHEIRNLRQAAPVQTEEARQIIDMFQEDDNGMTNYRDAQTKEARLLTFVTIDNTPNWKLITSSRLRNVMEDIVEFAEIMLSGTLIIILFTLVLTRIVTGKTLKPIIILTQAAKNNNIAPMDQKMITRGDEITSLYVSYNDMTDTIKKNTEKLEKIVEERTKELNEANERLYSLATTDNLTGAMNRMQIIDKMENIMYNIRSFDDALFSILFIDLNNFKYYNDNFGHDIGDMLLIEMITFFRDHIRSNDFLGRYGGDEFIIVYPNMNEDIVPKVIKNLIKAMDAKKRF
jgi:GGDEF domain-containing protein